MANAAFQEYFLAMNNCCFGDNDGVSNCFDAALQHIFFGLSRKPLRMGAGRRFVAAELFDPDVVDKEIGRVPVRAIAGLWVFEEPTSQLSGSTHLVQQSRVLEQRLLPLLQLVQAGRNVLHLGVRSGAFHEERPLACTWRLDGTTGERVLGWAPIMTLGRKRGAISKMVSGSEFVGVWKSRALCSTTSGRRALTATGRPRSAPQLELPKRRRCRTA